MSNDGFKNPRASVRGAVNNTDIAALVHDLRVLASTTLNAAIEGSIRSKQRDAVNMAADMLAAVEASARKLAAPERTEQAAPGFVMVPVEIDYEALIVACYARTKHAQGTRGCIQFARGAEWYREQLEARPLTATTAQPSVEPVGEREQS